MRLIEINHKKCSRSYACVRICPVKAISTNNEGFPVVNHSRCIGCGSCLSVCGSDAVSHVSHVNKAIETIESPSMVAAIVDPTISGEFPDIKDYRKFVEMIRKLGFDYVSEISFGVDLIARKYKELISNFKGKYFLGANCPSLVMHVEKYYPALTNNLAPVVTPMTAMAKVVRKAYGQDLKVVCLGPCLSAMQDAMLFDGDGKVDAVLTFKELRELFDKFNIKEAQVEYSDFDPPLGNLGSLYPLPNGIVYASGMSSDLMEGAIITASGKENMLQLVDEFGENSDVLKKHFSIFYDQGCLMGPGTTDHKRKFLRRSMVVEYSLKRSKNLDKKLWENNMEKYMSLDLSRGFNPNDQRLPEPNPDRVEEIMKTLGKDLEERASSCSSCGFATCKDFAVSIGQGISKPEMCLEYSVKSKNNYIKVLKTNNEKQKKSLVELQETEKLLKSEVQRIKLEVDTISGLLQNLPAAAVIVDEKLTVLQSNPSFVKILGEEAELINEVIPGLQGADLKSLLPHNIYNLFSYVLETGENVVGKDVDYGEEGLLNISIYSLRHKKIAGAVFRDMTLAEVRQEEIVKRVTEVVDQNLKMVQNIAFLLGEGASTTEKMLNSVIETYQKTRKT